MATQSTTKKSIGVSFATQYVEMGIQFLGVLVLARILSPDDIGVFSVASFLMTLLHAFRDFGVVQYIIQERDLTREKIQAAMGVAIMLALAVALTLLACSGAVARFYGNPEIQKVLVVMAGSFAISPFGSLLIGIFRREFQLKTIFYIKTISAICHVAVAITLAFNGFGALSLAWANFAGILSFGIAANLMRPAGVPWTPRLKHMGTILSFGGIASLGNAANQAGANIPDMVIGKVMNMAAVGYFSRAAGLVQLFTRLITGALLPLVLPYFSERRREGTDLAVPYLASVELLTALAWPFFAGLALLASPMIRTLYGDQWDASVPIVRLLCLAGAIASIALFAAQVMVASGQVRNSTYCNLIAQPFRVAAVVFGSTYGLMAIALGLVVSEVVTLAVVSWFLHRTIAVGPLRQLQACARSAVVTACAAIGPALVLLYWPAASAHPSLPLGIGIAGAAIGWLGSMQLVNHPLGTHIFALLTPLQAGWRGLSHRAPKDSG
jgi:O-antigen/teichoic acid export membrane protein